MRIIIPLFRYETSQTIEFLGIPLFEILPWIMNLFKIKHLCLHQNWIPKNSKEPTLSWIPYHAWNWIPRYSNNQLQHEILFFKIQSTSVYMKPFVFCFLFFFFFWKLKEPILPWIPYFENSRGFVCLNGIEFLQVGCNQFVTHFKNIQIKV